MRAVVVKLMNFNGSQRFFSVFLCVYSSGFEDPLGLENDSEQLGSLKPWSKKMSRTGGMPPNSDVICGKKDATLPSPGESQQNPPNSHVFPENLASFPRKCGVIPFYLILIPMKSLVSWPGELSPMPFTRNLSETGQAAVSDGSLWFPHAQRRPQRSWSAPHSNRLATCPQRRRRKKGPGLSNFFDVLKLSK